MAKQTLLDMVQNILSSLSGSKVNSISDTEEAEEIAEIIKETYFDLFSNKDTPEHEELIKLEGLSDINKPNYLKVPVSVEKFKLLKYDISEDSSIRYRDLTFVQPPEFLDIVLSRNTEDSSTDAIEDTSGIKLPIRNDKMPDLYTMFDDEHVVCDSYDSTVDSTLQASKTLCLAKVEPVFTISDNFVPDIDSNQFPLLLQESKAMAFALHKQTQVPKLEKRIRKNKQRLINDLHKNKQGSIVPDYGR